MAEKPSFENAMRALAAEARRNLDAHLSPEELLDYHAGDLAEDGRERAQEHLVLCPACTRALLDLRSFPDVEPAAEADRLPETDLAGEWRRFAEHTGGFREPRPPAAFPPALVYALAATLLLAVGGLSLWIGRLREEIRALSGPQANVLVADLSPREEAVERSADGEEEVRVPAWTERLILILNLAEAPSAAEYRIEIAGPDGREVWNRRGLRPSADGNFTLEIPRSLLPAGSYTLRLQALQGDAWTPAAEYGARIEPK